MNLATTIDPLLSAFMPYRLDDPRTPQLLDRLDRKFLLPASAIPSLLRSLRDRCHVLDIDARRRAAYRTLYFDTPDLQHYLAHHNGRLTRYKVRRRTYVEQSSSFLEVKGKRRDGRTVKQRMALCGGHAEGTLHGQHAFLQACGVMDAQALMATQICEYSRMAFAELDAGERLTIDLDLRFRDAIDRYQIGLAGIAVVELKQPAKRRASPLAAVLADYGARESGFSKYCVGMCLLRGPSLKTNRFKETLLRVERIIGQRLAEDSRGSMHGTRPATV